MIEPQRGKIVDLEDSGQFVCSNPSSEILRSTLNSQAAVTGSFFILHASNDHFLQGALNVGGFYLEYQEDGPDSLFVAEDRQSMESTLRIAISYVNGEIAWKEMCTWIQKTK